MTKTFYITFNTTHATMKANKLLKSSYATEVVPAPKELSKSGCSIALKIKNITLEEEILDILKENNLQIRNTIVI